MILSRLLFAFALPLASPVAAQPRAVPTIVFESGLGDGAGVWDQMIKKLGDAAPVYAYDRPGYGRTPKPRTPRDPCSIATELHDRLRIERITPPYLLVGHSLGGQYAYAFARLFPQETAGLVLVDATPIGHWAGLRAQFPDMARLVNVMRALTFKPIMRREFDAQDTCLEQLPATPALFPVRVLVRTKTEGVGTDALLRMDQALSRRWLKLSGAARIEAVEGSGHYIQRDKTDVLVAVIRELLGKAEASPLKP